MAKKKKHEIDHPMFDKIKEIADDMDKLDDNDVRRFSFRSYLHGVAAVDRQSPLSQYILKRLGRI